MEEGLDNIPQNPSADAIEELYLQGTNYLKTRVGFVFENPKLHPRNWTISTWAKNVKQNVILTKALHRTKQTYRRRADLTGDTLEGSSK